MFIFDSNRFARERAGLPSEVEKLIKAAGGEVVVTRLWEERRLAYAIGTHRKGTYWLMYFRAPSSAIAPLNRQFELQEAIIRHLVLKVHPHLVDAVLEHAKAGPVAAAPQPVAAGPNIDVHMPEEDLN
jgi:small subunit ribosomal protein S6